MSATDTSAMRAAVQADRERVVGQIADLEISYANIVDAAELTSTDDEHDPEGATIAYERAQVWALLRRARDDLTALDEAVERMDAGTFGTCTECGRPIAVERLMALPAVRTCIHCARR